MPRESMVKQDLRREPRIATVGSVTLQFEGHELEGRLLDFSSSGFRAAHDCGQLGTGAIVRFCHPGGAGKARVVWTRISAGGVESGFLIVY